MVRYVLAVAALLALAALAPSRSYAACTWKWDCSDDAGSCRQVPVCESPIDIPPPKPPGIPPVPTPRLPRITPLPDLPEAGRTCSQRYICDGGQCAWRKVCQ